MSGSHWWLPIIWLLPLLGALGSRSHLWPWWLGFAFCLLAALISLLLLMAQLWRKGVRHGRGTYVALLLPPLLLPILFALQAIRTPLTNDISTDPYNPPPLRWASELRGAGDLPINPPPLKAFAGNPGPLYSWAAPDEVLTEAEELMRELGWQVRPVEGGLNAVVTTRWFGFQDDVALRVFAGPKETRIDMRSASRQGQSDLGTNRARILAFFDRLNERLGGAYKPKMRENTKEQDAY
ncbi:MAG: DUF1499 domain-containing protein [Aeromonas sp.]